MVAVARDGWQYQNDYADFPKNGGYMMDIISIYVEQYSITVPLNQKGVEVAIQFLDCLCEILELPNSRQNQSKNGD